MDTYKNGINVPYAPTDTVDLYPDTDGKPIAASDLHLEILIGLLQTLKAHFAQMPDVYVSGDILTYYTEGEAACSRRTGCAGLFWHWAKETPHLQGMGRGEGSGLCDGVLKQNHLSKRSNRQDDTLRGSSAYRTISSMMPRHFICPHP